MITSSVVDHGFKPWSEIKPKTLKLVFSDSLLLMNHQGGRNCISGVIMFSMLALSSVDRLLSRIKPKTIILVFACFPAKHALLKSWNKDWLAQNQDSASEWGNTSTYGLLFQ
jgi:hypothetical protein